MLFQDWIKRIWEIESGIGRDFVYWGTKVACMEMIRTGTTVFNDQYWFSSTAREAAVEMGILPAISYIFLEGEGRPSEEEQKRTGDCASILCRLGLPLRRRTVSLRQPHPGLEGMAAVWRILAKSHALLVRYGGGAGFQGHFVGRQSCARAQHHRFY